MTLTKLFREFFDSEQAGGILILCCAVFSLIVTNSPLHLAYSQLWNVHFAGHSIQGWINDALMALFFLLIGLELEREIYVGELSSLRSAALPVTAAVGGMALPALIYGIATLGQPTFAGAGIPTATDIAFSIAILSLLGSRVPTAAKVFLTAVAIADDLGSILIIALFYGQSLSGVYLLLTAATFGALLVMNRLGVARLLPYLAGGGALWFFMQSSGIHPTLSGVLLAFAIPFGNGDEKSPSYVLQHFLHKPVALLVLPLFALANTCVILENDWFQSLRTNHSLGIIAALIFGKPLGILLASFLGVFSGFCQLPEGMRWPHIAGLGSLAGIGFTMSILITLLAFADNPALIAECKIAILVGSLLSGSVGFLILKVTPPLSRGEP